MKKQGATMQEGFGREVEANSGAWAVFVVVALIVGVLIGALIGSPSKADRQQAEAIKAEYQALKTGIEKAAAAPREDWSCTQGKVDVNLKTVEQVIPGWRYFSVSGHLEEGTETRKTIKVVSEHTTMDCNRQVKQYTE
ncbi:MAG: hypothetical protein HQL97_15510 [Magnetococcales bacterium]|nr:hypothetical protein [Magnetococcales bacterium]